MSQLFSLHVHSSCVRAYVHWYQGAFPLLYSPFSHNKSLILRQMRAEHGAALLVMFTAIKNGHATVQLSSNPVGTTSVKLCLQIVICWQTNHQGVRKNSCKHVRSFQIEFEFESVGYWGDGKICRTKGENQQQTQPTWHWQRDLNLGHIGEKRVLSPLPHPCSL